MNLSQYVNSIPPKNVLYIAIAFLVIWFIYIFYFLFDELFLYVPPAIDKVIIKPAHHEEVSLVKISRFHLFGIANARETGGAQQNAPVTNLKLTLHGLFTEIHGKGGAAIISSPEHLAKAYYVGSRVPGGAKIRKILRNKVVLFHNGRLELLLLKKIK